MRQLIPLISGASFACRQRTPLSLRHPRHRLPGRLSRRLSMALESTLSSTEGVPYFEYQPIEGVERLERYRPGGYHPILIGDVLKDRYRVVHKLGHGTYSTVWLSHDELRGAYFAIKISTDDSPLSETDTLHALTESSQCDLGLAFIPKIRDQFEIHGPNGHHSCSVTSPAQSSLAAASFSRLFTIETARALVAELILAVEYTHSRGFVHGDIHLGNFLIQLPSSFNEFSVERLYQKFGKPYMEPVVRLDGKPLSRGIPSHGTASVWLGKKANEITLSEAHILLSDFGEAFSPDDQTRHGVQCHTPLLALPPEAYFESDKALSFPADIWSLACAIWSILGPRPLFDRTLATYDDICSQQVDILGPLPPEWWDKWETCHDYFDRDTGAPKTDRHVFPSLEGHFEQEIQARRQKDGMGEFDKEEMVAILAMLRPMLAFRPDERATAKAVLSSDWTANWGLPTFKKVPKES